MSAASGRPAVLIVDDNGANRVAMQALLSSLDLEIASAPSGEEALKQLLDRDFAVVLMDVQMPGMDGFQTAELIRQRDRTRHTPVIFVTAIFTDPQSERKAYELGALDFVTKPFDDAILRAKVAALAGRYQQSALIERQAEALRQKQREADREHAARQAAEEANRAKDEFLAMLSHELRAPLNTILGWSSLLESDATVPAKIARALEAITRSARAQSRLVDDLIDVSQIVAHTLTIDPTIVDLAAITEAAVAAMAPAAAHRQVRVELDVRCAPSSLHGDGRRLEQLVTHLLSNAVKFSEAGGTVSVTLEGHGGELRLRVRDRGVGVCPKFLPHMFERLRQHDGTRTRRHGGLGIGLTVARCVAELHGGTITGASDGPGRGAEFVVTLPAREVTLPEHDGDNGGAHAGERARRAAVGDASATSVAVAGALHGLSLLVVDDDDDTRDLLATLLEDFGATVATAACAAEAAAAYAAARFDMLVSDLGMPGQDGFSLLASLRAIDAARGGSLVAVAVSGYGSAEDLASSKQAGFAAHVVKPFESSMLVALLARLRP